MKDAANALRKYKRDGANDINPEREEHKDAYIALRDTKSRCTALEFEEYLASLKNVVTQGATAKKRVWAVPKANFPDGLPTHIEEYRKPEEDCEGFIVDHKHCWVIDQFISRQELFGGVFPIAKFLKTELKGSISAAGSSTKGPHRELLAPGSPTSGGKPPATCGDDRIVKRHGSDASGELAVLPAPSGVKRPAPCGEDRLVKRQVSDAAAPIEWSSPSSKLTKDEQRVRLQIGTLRQRSASLIGAVAKGNWVDVPGSLLKESFFYYAEQTVLAVTEMKKFATESAKETGEVQKVEVIAADILVFLMKALTSSPVYPDICQFKVVLADAMKLAGGQFDENKQKELLLIDKLADIPADSDATFSTAEASVFVSRVFLDSELFKSYLQHRGATMLANAKKVCLQHAANGAPQAAPCDGVCPGQGEQ